MKRLATIAGAALLAAVLLPAPASAQMDVVMKGSLNDMPSDAFACAGGAVLCNLYFRNYSEAVPSQVNSPNAPVDGWPSYAAKPARYVGDLTGTGNFDATANNAACEFWYQIWTGTVNPGLGTFRSYYGSQSQIVNFGDRNGNSNANDCLSLPTAGEACWGALNTGLSRPSSPNTPLGTVAPEGSLAPVPIPSVTASDIAGGTVSLSWPAAAQANTTNVPTADAATIECPPGTTADRNDETQISAANPVYGVGLFVHTIANSGDPGNPTPYRSLASLEGSSAATGALEALSNPGTQIGCTGASDCPGVHPVPCNGVVGATCVGDGTLFAPTAQAITLTQAQVNAALGTDGPLDGGDNGVLNTKVFFRCSVPGSCANAARGGANPSLVSLFSSNSTRFSFDALVSRAVFDGAPVVQGNRVTLAWSTIGGPFVEFRLERSDNGIDFTQVGSVAATGSDSYQFTDTLRGRMPGTATYRLIVVEPSGESQIFTTVDLSPGSRSPRR